MRMSYGVSYTTLYMMEVIFRVQQRFESLNNDIYVTGCRFIDVVLGTTEVAEY
jgi:hypothetical protein